ncbi:MAG: SPFH domain-containing protein [Arenicellales bacterium]|jgi:regulator of protease activity HflC (stomatin/prohibitin superfamily)|nr:SPFH domain-containing protein [Arenicellales bacterium]
MNQSLSKSTVLLPMLLATNTAFAADAFTLGGSTVFVLIIVFLAILLVFKGVKTVPQGYQYTVERFGRFTKALAPGLNLIVPFIDQVTQRVNMMEQVLDIESQSVISKDNAVIQADGVVFFQVLDAAKATYEVNQLGVAMQNLCLTNIRTVLGAMNLDEILSNRDDINASLLKVVDAATDPWGVKVTRIEIKDLDPPADLVEAMSRQMKAERQKRADILEAEGKRQAEILRAEGEKQGAILEAEGRKESAFRDAEARERLAEAEAKATQMMSEAIKSGDAKAINYFVAQKYVEALQAIGTAENEKLVLLPMEATGILGSLAGIGELAKNVFGDKKDV